MKSVAVMALAGLTAGVSAQSAVIYIDAMGVGAGDFAADTVAVAVGDMVMMQVSVGFTGADYLFGANLQVNGSHAAWDATALTAGSSVGASDLFDGGTASGSGMDNVSYANIAMAQTGGMSDNPFILGTFMVHISDVGLATFTADKKTLGTTAALQLATGGLMNPPHTRWDFADASEFTIVSDTLAVPAPMSLGLLGIAGLAGLRRRR